MERSTKNFAAARAENERVELLRRQRAALVDEVMFLADAVRQLESYGAPPSAGTVGSPASAGSEPPPSAACPRAGALYDDFVKATPTCKATLARVLASVSNARTLGRAEHEKLEYMLLAQAYEAALDDSETAIAQVDSLIRIPLEQLAKAYGSGIRAEELSNVINALGLSAIAVRVR